VLNFLVFDDFILIQNLTGLCFIDPSRGLNLRPLQVLCDFSAFERQYKFVKDDEM